MIGIGICGCVTAAKKRSEKRRKAIHLFIGWGGIMIGDEWRWSGFIVAAQLNTNSSSSSSCTVSLVCLALAVAYFLTRFAPIDRNYFDVC